MVFRVLLLFAIPMLILSCSSSINDADPPIANKEIHLKIKSSVLELGFSTREQVISMLGNPEKSVASAHGGEDFYWDDLIEDTYSNPNLTIIYPRKTDRIVQMIYRPTPGEQFEGIYGTDQDSSIEILKQKFSENKKKYDIVGTTTIWLSYFESRAPIYNISCGYQFKDNSLFAINYMIDGDWKSKK